MQADLVLRLADVPAETRAMLPKGSASYGRDAASDWLQDVPGGYDDNPEMTGRQKYAVIREAVRSDPAVKSLDWMLSLPARSAEAMIRPASSEPIDVLIADCLAWTFGLGAVVDGGRRHYTGSLDLTWDASLSQALKVIRYGSQGEEMVWGDLTMWTDADGDLHPLRPLARLAPRMASSVEKWKLNPTTGQIEWIEQNLPNVRPIPGDALVWYTIDPEPGSIFGESVLRPALGPWKLKRNMMIAHAVGFDRLAAGLPIVRYPTGSQNETVAKEIARSVRVHERGYVTFEGPPPGDGQEGWDLTFADGSKTLADPIPMLRYYDQQIAAAGLQQFSSLGTSETGSRAVGEVLAEPYYYAVQAILGEIAQKRMKHVFRRFVDVNFGARYPVPELAFSKVTGKNIAVLARALADLSSAGLTFTDPDTQNDVRDLLDLRHLPDEVQEAADQLPGDVGIGHIDEGGSIAPAKEAARG